MFNILHQEDLLIVVVLEAVLGVLPNLFDKPQPPDHPELLLHEGVNMMERGRKVQSIVPDMRISIPKEGNFA